MNMNYFRIIRNCSHGCTCGCHRHPGTKHVAACCTQCDICGHNITMGQMENHLAVCHKGEKVPSLADQMVREKINKEVAK